LLSLDDDEGVVVGSLDRSGVVIVVMIAIAQCWPIWQHHWFNSHEYYAYVLRVVEFEAALRQGDLYPRWAADFYGGYGSPFFVFYAPLVFVAGAVFSAVSGSALLGLKAWIVVASVAAGLGTYLAVKAETHRSDAALLAALLYLAAPYRLANIYVRGDIAEYTALAILPWAVWSYRRVARSLPLAEGVGRGALSVAIHALLIFSHAITGLWGTALLGVLCLATTYQLWRRRTFRHIGLIWAAFALALAVSSIYTGPALVQKRYVHIAIASFGYYDPTNQLLPVSSLLQFGQFGILPLVLAALLLTLLAACLRRGATSAVIWASAAALYAFLSTRYAESFWELKLPLTSFIQFPWRLHGFAALAAVIALGLSWALSLRPSPWREPAALALGACALLASSPVCQITSPFAKGSFPETTSEIRASMHHTTADEYLPLAVRAAPRSPAAALVLDAQPHIDVVSSWSLGSTHELELAAERTGSAELALHMFPGWYAETVEGPAHATISTSKAGRVSLVLPAPGRYRLKLGFGSSPVRAAFGTLSLLALLATWPVLRLIAGKRLRVTLPTPALEPTGKTA
jgi:uncharacterized membrane protein